MTNIKNPYLLLVVEGSLSVIFSFADQTSRKTTGPEVASRPFASIGQLCKRQKSSLKFMLRIPLYNDEAL